MEPQVGALGHLAFVGRAYCVGMDDGQVWFDRADMLASRGRNRDEAERLLRDAIAAGHGPALVRLAEFLWHESGRDWQDVIVEVEELLSRAVDQSVPRAANTFGNVLADTEQYSRAEQMFRRAIADGDPSAATNLASVLHDCGADRDALRCCCRRPKTATIWPTTSSGRTSTRPIPCGRRSPTPGQRHGRPTPHCV
jgi:hypothetical protein